MQQIKNGSQIISLFDFVLQSNRVLFEQIFKCPFFNNLKAGHEKRSLNIMISTKNNWRSKILRRLNYTVRDLLLSSLHHNNSEYHVNTLHPAVQWPKQ